MKNLYFVVFQARKGDLLLQENSCVGVFEEQEENFAVFAYTYGMAPYNKIKKLTGEAKRVKEARNARRNAWAQEADKAEWDEIEHAREAKDEKRSEMTHENKGCFAPIRNMFRASSSKN